MASKYVLTAAHCVFSWNSGQTAIDASDLQVKYSQILHSWEGFKKREGIFPNWEGPIPNSLPIVKLRSRSRSGEGQVRVRKVRVRQSQAQRTQNSRF